MSLLRLRKVHTLYMQPHRYHIDEKETDYGPVELNDYGNSHVSQLHYQRQEYGDPNVNDLLD